MQTQTRTDLVDAQTKQIELWRTTATRGRTAARAFEDYGKEVDRLPTKGDVADEVAELISDWCKEQAAEYKLRSAEIERQADRMERDLGIGS